MAILAQCTLALHIPAAQSLKDKRRVVKSLVQRVRARFNVSIAETDSHDIHQQAVLTAVVVSTSRRHAESVLTSVIAYVEAQPGDAYLDHDEIVVW